MCKPLPVSSKLALLTAGHENLSGMSSVQETTRISGRMMGWTWIETSNVNNKNYS